MTAGGRVAIDRIGAQGDGIADGPDGAVYVPFGLPGETWGIAGGKWTAASAVASPERRAPVCRHFGTCGGCVAQHMSPGLYADWKRGIVAEAFRQRGIDAEISPLFRVQAGSRRRASFTARRTRKTVQLGYLERGTHTLCHVEACPVLVPQIEAALPGLRAIAGIVLPRGGEGRITVTLAPTRQHRSGLDVAVTGGAAGLDAERRRAAAQAAQAHGFLRLNVDGERLLAGPPPVVAFSGVEVTLPDQAFLQAVPAAETEIARLAVEGVAGARRVADLFCGLGTLSFAMATESRVLAVDVDAGAIAALTEAMRHAQGLKPIEARRRDLIGEPLSMQELNSFDAIVLDPPRAGADAQAKALAASAVPRVVMVSCNPATLARDVRTLVDGGYRPGGPVTPIDQFVYSAHVEAVCVLERA